MSNSIRRLGRYDIVGHLASGGMASVYRARLAGTGGFSRDFALKVIHPHLCDTREFIDRFLNEAWIASRLHHPNVAATVDAGTDAGYYYIVLELIEGITLRQLLRTRSAPLPADCAARVVADAARGLHALHQLRDRHGHPLHVIHRDLSPHNVMLDVSGRGILIDLGLAKVNGAAGQTQTGVLCGRLPYMSPEQSRNAVLDGRSDVFSLGSVLWELVTGHPPFGEDHSVATLARLQRCDLGDIHADLQRHGVPSWLAAILQVCLQRDPERRFVSALALAEALEQEADCAGLDATSTRRQLVIFAQQARGNDEPASSDIYPAPLRRLGPGLSSRWLHAWPRLASTAAVLALVGSWLWSQSPAPAQEHLGQAVDHPISQLQDHSVPNPAQALAAAVVAPSTPRAATTRAIVATKSTAPPPAVNPEAKEAVAREDAEWVDFADEVPLDDDPFNAFGRPNHEGAPLRADDRSLGFGEECPPSSQVVTDAGHSHACGESGQVSQKRRRALSTARHRLRRDTTTTLRPNPYDAPQ